jgi:hypothetical protein
MNKKSLLSREISHKNVPDFSVKKVMFILFQIRVRIQSADPDPDPAACQLVGRIKICSMSMTDQIKKIFILLYFSMLAFMRVCVQYM